MTEPVMITDGRYWLMVHPDYYREHKDDLAADGWHKQEWSNPMHLDRDLPEPYGTGALQPPDDEDQDQDEAELQAELAADARAMQREGN